jgi:hypothetical protein
MANTYTLISSITVGSGGAASIDFTSIPATYTDLVLKLSTRSTTTDPDRTSVLYTSVKFNNTATTYNTRTLRTTSAAEGSFDSSAFFGYTTSSAFNASNFDNGEIYIPNYAGSNQKSFSIDSSDEQNVATYDSTLGLIAARWDGTSAINRITLALNYGNFAQHSTAYLYGISNA